MSKLPKNEKRWIVPFLAKQLDSVKIGNAQRGNTVAAHGWSQGTLPAYLTPEQEAALQKAVALNPAHPNALNALAGALTKNRQIEEAIACYQQALRLDPGDAIAREGLDKLRGGQTDSP